MHCIKQIHCINQIQNLTDSIKVNEKRGMKAVMPGVRVIELANSSKQVLQALTNRESMPEEVYCYEVRQETELAKNPEGYLKADKRLILCILVKTSKVQQDHKKGTTAPLVGTRYKGTPGTESNIPRMFKEGPENWVYCECTRILTNQTNLFEKGLS